MAILGIYIKYLGCIQKRGQSPKNFTPPPLDEDGFTVACIEEKETKIIPPNISTFEDTKQWNNQKWYVDIWIFGSCPHTATMDNEV